MAVDRDAMANPEYGEVLLGRPALCGRSRDDRRKEGSAARPGIRDASALAIARSESPRAAAKSPDRETDTDKEAKVPAMAMELSLSPKMHAPASPKSPT